MQSFKTLEKYKYEVKKHITDLLNTIPVALNKCVHRCACVHAHACVWVRVHTQTHCVGIEERPEVHITNFSSISWERDYR